MMQVFEMIVKKMKETINDIQVLKRLRGLRLNENNENKCSNSEKCLVVQGVGVGFSYN